MPTYVDTTISGDGSIDFSSAGSHVIFLSFSATTIPTRAGHAADGIADHWLRIGWFSLGDALDVGDGTLEYWREINWWNFTNNLWTPVGSTESGGGAISVAASRIRYFVYPGGAGHLHILGS